MTFEQAAAHNKLILKKFADELEACLPDVPKARIDQCARKLMLLAVEATIELAEGR